MNDKTWTKAGQKAKIVIGIILLFMILSRLTWLQVRSFKDEAHPRLIAQFEYICSQGSPTRPSSHTANVHFEQALNRTVFTPPAMAFGNAGLCQGLRLDWPYALGINKWILLMTILLAVLYTRSLTRSWILSLMVCAVLLSRGALLARVSEPSLQLLLSGVVTLWVASAVHYVKTGAWISLISGIFAAVLGALICMPLAALCLVMPLFILFSYRKVRSPILFSALTEERQQQGSLFCTITIPFLVWLSFDQRWKRLTITWLAVFVLLLIGLVNFKIAFRPPNSGGWVPSDLAAIFQRDTIERYITFFGQRVLAPFDLHYFVSISAMLLALLYGQKDGFGFRESTAIILTMIAVLFIVGFGITIGAAAFYPPGEFSNVMQSSHFVGFLNWVEPVVISFGMLSLISIARSRFG